MASVTGSALPGQAEGTVTPIALIGAYSEDTQNRAGDYYGGSARVSREEGRTRGDTTPDT
jgi:hypothetical protein